MKKIKYILFFGFVVLLFLLGYISSMLMHPSIDTYKTKIDTFWNIKNDTIYQSKPVFDSIIISKDKLYIPSDYDTLKNYYKKMAHDYNSTKYYNDTIINDSLITICLKEKVTKNDIYDREVYYTYKYPSIIETRFIKSNPNELKFVAGISLNNAFVLNPLDMCNSIISGDFTPKIGVVYKKMELNVGYNLKLIAPVTEVLFKF